MDDSDDSSRKRKLATASSSESQFDPNSCALTVPDDFSCVICQDLLCEPLTLTCGHTYCRLCVASALERLAKRCPTCRVQCHIDASTHPVTLVLANVLQKLFPQQYEQRKKDSAEERARLKNNVIPLFFLGSTLFPGGEIDLHLFEQRYRIMMKRIMEGNRLFGLLAAEEVGTVVAVQKCEFLPDGRAVVQGVGQNRFKIVDMWVEDATFGLHYARIEELHDEDEAEALQATQPLAPLASQQLAGSASSSMEDAEQHASAVSAEEPSVPGPSAVEEDVINLVADGVVEVVAEGDDHLVPDSNVEESAAAAQQPQSIGTLATEAYRLLEQMINGMPAPAVRRLEAQYGKPPQNNPTALSFWICSFLPMPEQIKSTLLETTSTRRRLEIVLPALRRLLGRNEEGDDEAEGREGGGGGARGILQALLEMIQQGSA